MRRMRRPCQTADMDSRASARCSTFDTPPAQLARADGVAAANAAISLGAQVARALPMTAIELRATPVCAGL
jgi:hypothetical protein